MNTPLPQLAFRLKVSHFTLTILQLYHSNLKIIEQQLSHLVKQTPHFFQNTPVVIELQQLPALNQPDFLLLAQCLRKHSLIPVGVRSGTEAQQAAATQAGLAIFTSIKSNPVTASSSLVPIVPISKLVTQPVRSGQQIYACQADLIVLASVSPGAELLADGNIHVYGRLQGRALAGINGNQEARIFCQALAAELVSIAGHYWVSEDLQKNLTKEPVAIYLKDKQLHTHSLY